MERKTIFNQLSHHKKIVNNQLVQYQNNYKI